MYQKGRAWIELNMKNLAYNVEQLQAILPKSCELMPAVKANAYGHGAVPISLALQRMGVRNFCVATVDEAIELRKAGIEGQILIMCYTSPYRFEDLCRYELTQTVIDYDYARLLNEYGYTLNVHVGIDTGMHRLGIDSHNIEEILAIWKLHNIKVGGVFSHLCVSDGRSKEDKEFTIIQIECFKHVIDKLHKAGIYDFKAHIQGSYGVLNYPDLCFDYARVGIALYGILSSQSDETKVKAALKPVLSLKSRIECIKILHEGESLGYGLSYTAHKKTRAAVVSIGYADGIPRELSNKGRVLIHGKAAPMIGRICMDQLSIDVSDIPEAAAGDEVVLIGRCCNQELTAGEYADSVDTITNEILSRLGNRLERTVY